MEKGEESREPRPELSGIPNLYLDDERERGMLEEARTDVIREYGGKTRD